MAAGDDARRQRFRGLQDFGSGRGLEIGPLHRALVRREDADVRYVDVQDRDGLVAHYADDDGVDTDLIPEIDYPLIQPDGTTLSLAQAAAGGAPFSWVVASHVVEHVPDLIGWLADIAEVAADGAALVLAVPDRRYSFDVVRPPTTVGQMVEAHLAGHVRPSPRAIYDYFSTVVDYDVTRLWRGDVPGWDRRLYGQPHVEAKLAESLETYVDAHVWLFTPQSFTEQLHELRVSGRSAWYVERLDPTAPDDNEFFVVLRRVDRAGTTADVADELTGELPGELLPARDRPEWVVTPDVSALAPALDARVEELRAALEERRDKLQTLRSRQRTKLQKRDRTIAALRAEVEHLGAEVERLRARDPSALAGRVVGRLRREVSRRRPGRR